MLLTPAFVIALVVVAVAAFAAGYVFARRRDRLVTDAAAIAAIAPLATRVAYPVDLPEEGTAAWKLAMDDVGERMRGAHVRRVVFVHGSFVGDDPLAIGRALDRFAPWVDGASVRAMTRAGVSRVLGDLSNFPRDYVEAFGAATQVETTEFAWSGENHHVARVVGAIRLARALVLHGGGSLRAGDRVLLVAHSHGGQLFAILSQLLGRATSASDLIAAAAECGEDPAALEDHLTLLRRCAIDVVTFGTPVRYPFAPAASFRTLHVVNHRGGDPKGASVRGVLHTREGDYVHHVGVPGSDFPALAPTERAVNAKLDRVLGPGSSARAWLKNVARGRALPTHGETLLVDYGDAGAALPNLVATGLGHSAYTRRAAMLFHARVVADRFYPRAEQRPLTSRVRALLARAG